jgi:hypothetical protein
MIRSTKISAWLMVMTLVAADLAGCRRTPDEQQVRQAIVAMQQAAQAGDARQLAASLSEDFEGNAGELDRASLLGTMRLIALRGDRLHVVLGPVTTAWRGDRIVATFTATLTSGSQLLPDQFGVYRLESAWRREGSHWRCYRASWKHPL